MKLRTKIQCLFGIVIIVILSIVTVFAYRMNYSSSLNTLSSNLSTTASIASDYIGQHLQDYMLHVVTISENDILSGNAPASEKITYVDSYAAKLGLTSANILDIHGVSIYDGTDFSDRQYVQKALTGESCLSELTLSKYTGLYGLSIATPIKNSSGSVTGVLYFRMDVANIQSLLDSFRTSTGCYSYIIDRNGYLVTHPQQDLIQVLDLKTQGKGLADIVEAAAQEITGYGEYELYGHSYVCGYSPIANTDGWTLIVESSTDSIMASATDDSRTLIIIAAVALIIALIVSAILANYISQPIVDVKNALVEIAQGNLSVKIQSTDRKDEIGILYNATSSLIHTLSQIIGHANRILGNIAYYDLTSADMPSYPGDFDTLSASINQINAIFNSLLHQIQESIANVDSGAHQLMLAADSLSSGTLAQANSIQLLEEHLNHIVDDTRQNSKNEAIVNNKLTLLDEQIRNGNDQMLTLLNEVRQIASMSADIQKIVDTIDSIAFQTNILSLNASVEAAHAGEMGRGFAVVAEEVRSLAEKSSESSKKTAELIDKCIAAISNAQKYADNTVKSLSVIVTDSSDIASAFISISEATKEEAAKSDQIQHELHNISDVVQSNTATAEETAASSAVLSDQAVTLHKLISNFKLK